MRSATLLTLLFTFTACGHAPPHARSPKAREARRLGGVCRESGGNIAQPLVLMCRPSSARFDIACPLTQLDHAYLSQLVDTPTAEEAPLQALAEDS